MPFNGRRPRREAGASRGFAPMDEMPRLGEAEFEAIEAALRATGKGRAFLRTQAERLRAVAVEDMRGMIRDELRAQLGQASEGTEQAHIRILRQELQEMSACIQQTRQEIAALRPAEPGHNRIMAATGELDAIVSATERATTAILTSAERIQALSERLPETDETGRLRREIAAEAIEILTACSFQDITGQRTTKVVNALRYLEQRVNAMVEIWGPEGREASPRQDEPQDRRPDAHLLNGPALAGGVSQDEVDALLAGFGPDGAAAAEPDGAAAADGSAPKPDGKAASQSEIDALFA